MDKAEREAKVNKAFADVGTIQDSVQEQYESWLQAVAAAEKTPQTELVVQGFSMVFRQLELVQAMIVLHGEESAANSEILERALKVEE